MSSRPAICGITETGGDRMHIRLRHADYEAMIVHARQQAPVEDCGLIGGTIQDGVKTIEKVFYLTNTDHSPEHFALDPQEQFAVVRELRSKGWSLLGNWHSHPASPSRPSEEDKRLAFDSSASYLILSLAADEPVLNSFQVTKDKTVTKETLELTE